MNRYHGFAAPLFSLQDSPLKSLTFELSEYAGRATALHPAPNAQLTTKELGLTDRELHGLP